VANEAQPSRSLRILIIDDDAVLLESLRQALLGEGHEVATAVGGKAGIEAFAEAESRSTPFDVVFTDLGMPYVDGRQVVQSIRAVAPNARIVLLTGWGQMSMSNNDPPPQVDRLLSKPPRLRELRQVLAELTDDAA
jgi:CheY-like chemotaxis protein